MKTLTSSKSTKSLALFLIAILILFLIPSVVFAMEDTSTSNTIKPSATKSIQIRITDSGGIGIPNVTCTLTSSKGEIWKGPTDSNGERTVAVNDYGAQMIDYTLKVDSGVYNGIYYIGDSVTLPGSGGALIMDLELTSASVGVPVITNTNTTINVNAGKSATLPVTINPVNPVPKYSIKSAESKALPTWITIDENKGIIEVSPPVKEGLASYNVNITATNTEGSDTKTFNINVKRTPKKYVYTSDDGSVTIELDYELPEGSKIERSPVYGLKNESNYKSNMADYYSVPLGNVYISNPYEAPIKLQGEAILTFHLDKCFPYGIRVYKIINNKFTYRNGFDTSNYEEVPALFPDTSSSIFVFDENNYYMFGTFPKGRAIHFTKDRLEYLSLFETFNTDTLPIQNIIHGLSGDKNEVLTPSKDGHDVRVTVTSLSPFAMEVNMGISPKTSDPINPLVWITVMISVITIVLLFMLLYRRKYSSQ